jgi:hypothetical protein
MFTRATIVPVLVLAAAAGGCQRPMEEFTSQEYKFKVKFPGKPEVRNESAHGIGFKMFGTESRNGGYVVGVADMPIPAGEPDRVIQDRLDGAVDGAVRNINGTNQKSSSITLAGKYPGRELTASITTPKQGQVRGRIYLVGTRLYQVLIIGTDSFATASQANEFLNSFQLIE